MTCPKCSNPMHKAGFVWSGSHKVQRYKCPKCGATTIKSENKAEFEKKEDK